VSDGQQLFSDSSSVLRFQLTNLLTKSSCCTPGTSPSDGRGAANSPVPTALVGSNYQEQMFSKSVGSACDDGAPSRHAGHGTASFLLSQPRVSALKQWRIKGALRPAHAVLENYELKIDKS